MISALKNNLIQLEKIKEERYFDGLVECLECVGCRTHGTHLCHNGSPLAKRINYSTKDFEVYIRNNDNWIGRLIGFKKHFNVFCFWKHLRKKKIAKTEWL